MKGIYQSIGDSIGELVDKKNKMYGDSINSTAEFLELLFPYGIRKESYKDIAILVRIYDKIKRVVAGNKGEENAWRDIAGYAILMMNVAREDIEETQAERTK